MKVERGANLFRKILAFVTLLGLMTYLANKDIEKYYVMFIHLCNFYFSSNFIDK